MKLYQIYQKVVMEPEWSLPPTEVKPNRSRPLKEEFIDEVDRLRKLLRE